MRDDSTPPLGPIAGPRPGFRLTDDDPHAELGPLSLNTVQPPEPLSPWRIAAVGAVGACVLGGVVGYMSLSHHPQNAGRPAHAVPAREAEFRPISDRYAPPDRDQIRAAYRDVAEVIAKEGLSGAARASMTCYERLSRRPEYGLMDYCLALDAFGAQAYERAAGESAPSSTYFGQAPVRRQQAVQHLTAGQTDANSRLIDTNRLIGEVVLAANALEPVALEPQVADVTTAPVATPPAPLPALPAPPPAAKVAPEPSIKSLPTPVIVAKAEPPKNAPIVAMPAKTAPTKPVAPKVEALKAATPKVAPAPAKAVKPVVLAKATAKAPLKPVKAPPPVLKAKTETKAVKTKEPLKLAKAKAPAAPAKPPTRLAAMLDRLKSQPVRNAPPPVSPLQKASDKKPAASPWMNQLEAELKGPGPARASAKTASASAVKRADAPAKPEPKTEAKAEAPPAPVQAAVAERREPPAAARAAAPEPQRRVQATNDVQPSFNCRGALTRGQRMVCEEPSLAAADRRMSSVFNRALDESPNPRALIAEQNRWLAARDRMAGDYGAVMSLYQRRIAELREGPY